MLAKLKSLYRFCYNLVSTPAVILIYHRVTHLESDPQALAVSPEHFDRQMAILKKKYNVLKIEDFYQIIQQRKKIPKGTVIITFDDGYADNLLEALPILEKHNLQALFYIATGNLNTTWEFWWDDLERIFLSDLPLPEKISVQYRGKNLNLSTASKMDRLIAYNTLHPLIKDLPTPERDQVMRDLMLTCNISKTGRASHRMLTSAEVFKLSQSPRAVIGAHTHHHPKLSVCTRDDQYHEMVKSKKILENLTKRKIEHFSYPFGAKQDYTSTTMNVAIQVGFKMVCANYYGHVHKGDNLFELPRVLVRNWTEEEFSKKMKRFFRF